MISPILVHGRIASAGGSARRDPSTPRPRTADTNLGRITKLGPLAQIPSRLVISPILVRGWIRTPTNFGEITKLGSLAQIPPSLMISPISVGVDVRTGSADPNPRRLGG